MELLQQEVTVTLNRFLLKELTQTDLTFYEYNCRPTPLPEPEDAQRTLSRISNQLEVIAVPLGNRIITQEKVPIHKLKTEKWELEELGHRVLTCTDAQERRALESFERKRIESILKSSYRSTKVERSTGGVLLWWITAEAGVELSGDGWEVHRGRVIDVAVEPDGKLYLEVDIQYRIYTPWTLHEWLENYPDVPIEVVRNTYVDAYGERRTWKYLGILSNQSPREIQLPDLNITLAEFHLRKHNAPLEEVESSWVVEVASEQRRFPHLSRRLSPVLTLEILASLEDSRNPGRKVSAAVIDCVRKSLGERLQKSKEAVRNVIEKVYKLTPEKIEPLKTKGYILPKPKLLGSSGRQVKDPAKVRYQGCAKVGETKFGCLNLDNDKREYPSEVRKCLLEIAQKSGVKVELDFYATQQDLPEGDLARPRFWQRWAEQGIKTVLVVMPWSPNERKQKIRAEALEAGIATQFMIPGADPYKALNVVLGLLCKAAWQPVLLEPLDHPERPELIIGFDVGTNRQLYYGASAFAVLADGQSLGWELPAVQRGETFSGESIYRTVSKLVNKFHGKLSRYPTKVLLMRDGLVQGGEFSRTIEELEKEKIAVDIVGIRKSGTGRMGREEKGKYKDAEIGTVVFDYVRKSFTLVTSQPISKKGGGSVGSARPLRVVHEYGSTPLEVLALQTCHLSQLHPASGFQACRLPWVLHFADKSGKEFQRLGSNIFNVLQNIDRQKLIAV